MSTLTNRQIFDLADRLKEAKARKKALEADLKALNAQIEDLDQALSDSMMDAELDKFTLNGSTFYITTRLFASPKNGEKEELFEVLRANGYGSLVTETVNANTLASFVKEQIASNDDVLPEWLEEKVTVFEKTSVGIRNG